MVCGYKLEKQTRDCTCRTLRMRFKFQSAIVMLSSVSVPVAWRAEWELILAGRGKYANGAIARPMTANEIRAARTIFGASIDYTRVKVHNIKAYFFQPSGTAITPNGEVYFPKEDYLADFGTRAHNMAWLIHELVHVWQWQRNMWVKSRRLLNGKYEYGDLSKYRLNFTDYLIEQQASIVEDYYRITHGLKPRRGAGSRDDYVMTIPFLPGRKA